MTEQERIEINNLAVSIMEGLELPEIFRAAKRIHDLTKDPQSGWIPCSERNPTKEGCYPVAIEINNPFQHGRYETRLVYDPHYLSNGWYASSDAKVLAWRENAPWSGEVKETQDERGV